MGKIYANAGWNFKNSTLLFAMMGTTTATKPSTRAKIRPTKTTFVTVLLLILSISAGVADTLQCLRSILVAIKICAVENIKPIKAQIVASPKFKLVTAPSKMELAKMEMELTMAQNKTFAINKVDAFMGNTFDLSAVIPSRETFVAQNVFVKMLNTSNTKSAKGKSKESPNEFLINDSNNV